MRKCHRFWQILTESETMVSTSKEWAKRISRVASLIYFLLVIFQIPLFRFPCRIGVCTTAIEVTSSQILAGEVLPPVAVKPLLYPGAITKAIISKKSIPDYKKLLTTGKFSRIYKDPSANDLKHMEVLAGSYFSIVGAVLGLIRPGRMSLFGLLLIVFGVARETYFGTKYSARNVSIYSAMYLALLCAFFSIRSDVRKLIRSFKSQRKLKYK